MDNNTKLNPKGLEKNDPRIKDYILYMRGYCWTPARFYDYLLIHKGRPYNHEDIVKRKFILADLNKVINRYDGISFEYLGN